MSDDVPSPDEWPEELIRRAVTHSPDCLLLLDADRRFQFISMMPPSVAKEVLLGKRGADFVSPEWAEKERRALDRARETGEVVQYEGPFQGDSPQPRTWETRARAIVDDGDFTGWALMTRDVTEQRLGSRDFERFFDIAEDYLAILDADGNVLRISPSVIELGIEPERMVGTRLLDGVSDEDTRRILNAMRQERSRVEFSWVGPDARRHLIDATIIRSELGGGRIYALGRNITEDRARQTQMAHSQKMEVVGQLAGGVAHDFNNLLQSVLVNADHALEALEPGSKAADYLRDLRSAAQLSADLTRQLLAFSRRQSYRPRQVDVGELTRRILSMLRRTIPENIEISYVPGNEVRTVIGDGSQLEQVLLNLALNARDVLRTGGRITISTEDLLVDGRDPAWSELRLGRYTVLSVADNGPGIPESARADIFEPFFTTKGRWGTGLGLAIVQDVVKRHEGHVRLTTGPDIGTRFDICLPVSDGASLSSEHEPIIEPAPGQGEHILLAEDEPFVRRAISRALRRAGYSVTVAGDGLEALAVVDAGEQIDVLLLDVVMPGLGGPGVVRSLRERGLDIPVVLASGYTDIALIDDLPPDVHVLQKPYHPNELLGLLREKLDPSGGEEPGE